MQANVMKRANLFVSIVLGLTVMSAGRAMTIGWLHRVGGGQAGDPPAAWLMPLVGDALVGLTALVVAYLLWRRPTPASWMIAMIWTAIAAFDALAALLVEIAVPWPDFVMLELFGRSMFVAAALIHVVIFVLLSRPEVRVRFAIG